MKSDDDSELKEFDEIRAIVTIRLWLRIQMIYRRDSSDSHSHKSSFYISELCGVLGKWEKLFSVGA